MFFSLDFDVKLYLFILKCSFVCKVFYLDKGIRRTIFWISQKLVIMRAEKLYKSFLNEGDLVFDVGANEGKLTKPMLKCGAKVVCVEPQSRCINILKNKFDKNKNVIVEEVALGNKIGKVTFNTCSSCTAISSLDKSWVNHFKGGEVFDGKETVKMITLDRLIKKYGVPKFIKIDVEGFEIEVLKGLHNKIGALCFEHTTLFPDKTLACISRLKKLGFSEFNYSAMEDFRFNQKWMTFKEINKFVKNIKGHDWGDIYAK